MLDFLKQPGETTEQEPEFLNELFADDIYLLDTIQRLNACKENSDSEACKHFLADSQPPMPL